MLVYLLALGVGQVGRLPRGDASAVAATNAAEAVQRSLVDDSSTLLETFADVSVGTEVDGSLLLKAEN